MKTRTAASILMVAVMLAGAGVGAQPRHVKLIVILAVDQMRGDYIDKFQHQWIAGLKRLVTEGAWFRQADYPYFNTITCAGHASISTGTFPSVHGMILNEWWDAPSQRVVSCTEDDAEKSISYGAPVPGPGHSARRLLASTLADELRMQHPAAPRVVSFSTKARSAINLGGHRPDVVTWLDDSGEWVTSTAFTKRPEPFVAEYIRAHPAAAQLGSVWDRALPKERYLYEPMTAGRRNAENGSLGFPHTIKGKGSGPDTAFWDNWESSPFADAYLNGLAMAAIDALKLGRGAGTDFLGVSFAGLDKVGHSYGPHSHEVQDILIRLDRELGTLLDKLDRDVGHGEYIVALSADHGVAPNPERVSAMGFQAGRIDVKKLTAALDDAIGHELGPGKYVATIQHTDIYFREGVYSSLVANQKALEAALSVVRTTPGVWRVYRKETLLAGASDADPITRAAARSYFDGRSGDLVLLPRAYWITSTNTTTHGTGHGYDTRVPVVLFGHGIRAGQYLQPASPIDIAPTLAFLTSVTLADPLGRVLVEALEPARTEPTQTVRKRVNSRRPI